jgi:hypothetical protein
MPEINITGPYRGGAHEGVPVITVASAVTATGASTRYSTSVNGNKTIRIEQNVAAKSSTFDIYGGFSTTDVGVKLNSSSITVTSTTPYMGTTPDAIPYLWVVCTAQDSGGSYNFKVAG